MESQKLKAARIAATIVGTAFLLSCDTRAGEESEQRVGATGVTPAAECAELAGAMRGEGKATGDICKVTFPRTDLDVSLLGAKLPPAMGLTAWAAFGPAGDRGAIVMGDLALTSSELPRVMSGLREHGIRITAVHRHMLGESPPMSFMHYLGIGEAETLARGLRDALDRMPTPIAAGARSGAQEGDRRLGVVAETECTRIAETLGVDPATATTGPGFCKVSRPRSDLSVRVEGIPVPASMGIGSWFAFRETTDGTAAVISGDLALTEAQVNPALGALRGRGIDVVALHNHMLHEEPRVLFFHFQARGEALNLAEGLRAGLESAGLVGGRAEAQY